MKKIFQVIFCAAVIFPAVFWIARAQNSGGYDVQTNLTPPPEAGPIKDANSDAFKTITERCQQSGIPQESFSACCNPPIYWLNPSCPYQMQGQNLVYAPQKQLGSDEENQAYQSVIDCLGNSGSDCENNSTVNSLVSGAKDKTDTCNNNCQSTYQSCVSQCNAPVSSGGGGPYVDSRANAAYFAVVQCLRGGGNCLAVAAQYVPAGSVNEIATRAMNDVQNGTVWQPPQASQADAQACADNCHTTGQNCVNQCPNYQDEQNKIKAAAQKAANDWQTVSNSPLSPPAPKPITSALQEAEKNATPVTESKITDANGKEVEAQDVLRGGLSDQLPVVTLQFPLEKAKAGQPIDATLSAGPPETFPVEEIILTPDNNIDNGTLAVTAGDNSKPELFIGSGQAKGQSDYDRPQAEPDQSLYDTLNYFRIDTDVSKGKSENEPVSYSDVLFSMVYAVKNMVTNPTGAAQYPNPEAAIELLHYNKNTQHWDELPTEQSLCSDEGLCKYAAKSPSASTFALVIKKQAPSIASTVKNILSPANSQGATSRFFIWPLIILLFAAVIYVDQRYWKKYANDLKAALATTDRRRVFGEIGFWRYFLLAGAALFGNGLTVIFASMLALTGQGTWDVFLAIFLADLLVAGPLFGLLTWGITWLWLKIKK